MGVDDSSSSNSSSAPPAKKQKTLSGMFGGGAAAAPCASSGSGSASSDAPEVLSVSFGIGSKLHDNEGRSITVEYADFFVVNQYVQ